MDIIIHSKGSQPIGFLASDEIEYADVLCKILRMEPAKRELVREAARYLGKLKTKVFTVLYYVTDSLELLQPGIRWRDFRMTHLNKNF